MTNTIAPEAAAETSKPVVADQPEALKEKAIARQIVSFQFFKVMPEWRRLPAEERIAHKREFAAVIDRWNQPDRLRTIPYSTVGMRGDCDMFLWRICKSVDDLNKMTAELLATPLGGYLETAHSFLAMTKRSQYVIGHEQEAKEDPRGFLRPGLQKYIFVYPFWKTRAWYLLPKEERQRLMTTHIRIGLQYPRVKLNTTYSFGLDDQEFVVAFETNYPEDFLDLVEQLRGTEISAYTLKDFPIFTCVRMSTEEMLDRIG